MRRNNLVAVSIALLVLASSPMVVSASSAPDFDVYVPENIVEPGEETTLELEIRNGASAEEGGDDVGETPTTEARDVTVTLDGGDGPVKVKSNETPMRTMSAQSMFSETFTVAVDEDAQAGSYDVDVEIEYTYTESGGSERSATETETIEVVVEDQARFDAETVSSDLVVGERGTVEFDLTNTGVENASNAVVQFSSPDQNVRTIDPTVEESELQTAGSEEYVGDWGINETVTVKAAMEVDDDALARTYPVSVRVQFQDENGTDRTARSIRVGVPASHEQTFNSENVTSSLYVGEDGTVEGELYNGGPYPVDGVVLVVDDGDDQFIPTVGDGIGSGSNVYPRETQYAVGSLKPGESTPFDFRIGVGSEAEPGPRMMEVDVRYRNAHGDIQMIGDPLDITLDVKPARDEFDIEPVETTFEPGERNEIELVITNEKDETLTDIEAKPFTNAPLDSGDDEGFVPVLEPGESASMVFDVTVDDDAAVQTYPLRMDFRYDDDRSNSQLTDTYRIPIEVEQDESGIISATTLAVLFGSVGVIAVVAWRFRDALAERLEGVPVLKRLSELSLPSSLATVRNRETDTHEDPDQRSTATGPDDEHGPDPFSDDGADVMEFDEVFDDAETAQSQSEGETEH